VPNNDDGDNNNRDNNYDVCANTNTNVRADSGAQHVRSQLLTQRHCAVGLHHTADAGWHMC